MSDIIRRDPRAERIARNRLHPLHAAMQQQGQTRWMGPNGVIRKNPHAIAVGFIGPAGIKRIDRSGAQQGTSGKRSGASEAVQLPLHVVAQPAFYIAVVPDMVGGRLGSHDKDLLGLASKLAGQDGAVVAVLFGDDKETAFDSAGIDRILRIQGEAFDGYAPEARVLALSAVESQLAPATGCCLIAAAAVANWVGAWPPSSASAPPPESGRWMASTAAVAPVPVARTWCAPRRG